MKNILTNLKQHDQTMYESMNHVQNILNDHQSLFSPTERKAKYIRVLRQSFKDNGRKDYLPQQHSSQRHHMLYQ